MPEPLKDRFKAANSAHPYFNAPTHPENLPNAMSLAVFPGGGTQGLISVYLAGSFERASERPFHESFDRIAGVSVGSINAAALWPLAKTGEPLMSTESLREFYETQLDGAFKKNWWSLGGLLDNQYDLSGFEKILKHHFGDLKLSDFADGLNIYVVDLETNQLRCLSSEMAKRDPTEDFRMTDLLRTAIAAPTYFDTVEIKNGAGETVHFIDAGVMAANPSFVEFFANEHMARALAITSFGTGNTNMLKLKSGDLNGGVADVGSGTLSTIFRATNVTYSTMIRNRLGDRFTELDVDLKDSGLGMISDIEDVIPHAQRAVRENTHRIIEAVHQIDSMREDTLATEEPAIDRPKSSKEEIDETIKPYALAPISDGFRHLVAA
jgi:patatin-like phospholipase/acyl hydrolase